MKHKIDYKKQGLRNRAKGLRFEKKVRDNLASQGFIVSKWQNNVRCIKYNAETSRDPEDWGELKLVPSSPGGFRLMQTGFPDFIAFRRTFVPEKNIEGIYVEICEIIGIEAKTNGYLDKIEKVKCQWYLDNKIFSKILIAKKGKKRGTIIYTDFHILIEKKRKHTNKRR